jgi:hypothetical protein
MKHIKLFENFKSVEDIDRICRKYNIHGYTINQDGSIDVDRSVDLDGKGLTEIPLNFNKVDGHFDVSGNKLKSLKGCPKHLSGSLLAYRNELETLEYFPKYIGGNHVYLSNNKLKNLNGWEDSDIEVADIDLTHNQITTLRMQYPITIGGRLVLTDNLISDEDIEKYAQKMVDIYSIGKLIPKDMVEFTYSE